MDTTFKKSSAVFLAVLSAAVVSCNSSGDPSGSRGAKAAFEAAVVRALGPRWTVSRRGNEITASAVHPPVIINTNGRSPQDASELSRLTSESAKQLFMEERFRVPIDFRITARTSLKLNPAEVQHRLSVNSHLGRDLRKLSKYESSIFQKVDLGDEGPAMASRYASLWHRAQQIPAGYFADLSVFLSKTNLGSARFLEPEDETRHRKAIGAILNLLDRYGGVRLRTDRDDVCKYNLTGDTIPVSCPW